MKKVLLLSEAQGWTGGSSQLFSLAEGLKGAGWEAAIASPEKGRVARRAAEAGIEHFPFHPRQDHDLLAAHCLGSILEEEKVDILHAHHPRAHAVGLASLYLSERCPVFIVTRRVSFSIRSDVFGCLKYKNPRIDGFTAVSDSIRRELVDGGVSAAKITTIPGGIDTSLYEWRPKDEPLIRELAIPEGFTVIAKFFDSGDWRRESVVLEAAVKLLERGRKMVFVFVGNDADTEPLRSRVRKAGLLDAAVRLLGPGIDIPRLLSICDISVNSSVRGEGVSEPLCRSLAMRIPVVASDTAGNAEIVRDHVTGRLFSDGSADDLVRVLGEMADDRVAAGSQAAEGCRIVRERFSIEGMVRATADYYRKLLERRSA